MPIYTPGKVVLRQQYVPLDANYPNVSLLLHGDGPNGSTIITDNSPSPKTVAANNGARISTAQSKFGGASLLFDGSDDFLSTPNNAGFDFGSSDLTIEAWVYISGNSPPDADGGRAAAICNTWGTNIAGWIFSIGGTTTTTGTGLQFDTWSNIGLNATFFRATVSLAQSTWHHIAVTVSGGTRRLFLNGTLLSGATTTIGSGYIPANNFANQLQVGRTPVALYPLPLNGYIDDLRITKSVARYTANFTPPTAPFPDRTDG